MIDLQTLVNDFCEALKLSDCDKPVERNYKPGIGPHTEAHAIQFAMAKLSLIRQQSYENAAPRNYPGKKRQICDLVIPGAWAIEFKLARPFGDNGAGAEHWIENVLYPYAGNQSAIGDCLKLRESGFKENLGVIIYGFEHAEPRIALQTAVEAFEVVARHVLKITLSPRAEATAVGLCHPVHQCLRVFGWQVFRD